ncbi:CsgG/HfaB family protein [Ferrimonas marina]|uniref:Curli production assembly/transport component CsgG n=1 Tax=Ferrimonas marina TaxID=299255 RepID=A0A1M5VQW7_9GAMM|nr:CsgG/HfaB family protein [Ferrimonas marina]SHH77384.1 curli production assembly/transport component CsgG [Ferrimonas marina]
MKKTILISLGALLLNGCAAFSKPELFVEPAEIDPVSQELVALQQAPTPKYKIPVAVYAFRDQTGQYKPQANVSSFSTAVTQGATSMLVQTLVDSHWFDPVEREGLQNLLTERKIIRQRMEDGGQIAPLSDARLLFEGGIISYDTNTQTGGIGMEYYGIGASELYRKDQVTLYLRAVDVVTGKVLLSVSSTKQIFSQEVRVGFFRYVSLNRLAEAEGGYSTNEPVQICVKQAMESAVIELIERGIEQGYWSAT